MVGRGNTIYVMGGCSGNFIGVGNQFRTTTLIHIYHQNIGVGSKKWGLGLEKKK